jgi:hypothetical protein
MDMEVETVHRGEPSVTVLDWVPVEPETWG